MRVPLWILPVLALAACDPTPAAADGALHQRSDAPSLKNYRSDCRPGRDPDDPDCCADAFAICRITCKDDYAENGDMLYLKHCLRDCEAQLARCREGR